MRGDAIRFVTPPIERFDMIGGASVNVVDKGEMQRIVAEILDGPSPSPTPMPSVPDIDATARPETSPAPAVVSSGVTAYASREEPIEAGGCPA